MWKTLTKERNRKFIKIYYVLALIFIFIGLFIKDPRWYIIAVAFLLLASFRKFWLMKRLKE